MISSNSTASSLYVQLTSQTNMKLFRDQQLEVFDLSTEGETACETVVYTRSPLSPHAHSHHMSNMNKHHIKITHAIEERTFNPFIVSVLKCFLLLLDSSLQYVTILSQD